MSFRHWAILFSLMASASSSAAAAGRAGRSISDQIGGLEHLYSQSFVTGDARVAERLLAADFIGFGPNGKRWDRATMVSTVRSLPHQTSAKITSITVRVHGDTAIALGTEEDRDPGSSATSHRAWLDSWQHMAQGWRLVASAEIGPKR